MAFNVQKVAKFERRWDKVLTGITYQTLDSKGRVILPQKFREELGESFIVTNGFNPKFRCVQFMSEEQFQKYSDQIGEMPASKSLGLTYLIIAPATTVTPNSQGRVQVPQAVRGDAKLEKELVVLGMGNRVEVWDKKTYDEFMAKSMEDSFEEALELLRLG